ncbi:MAG: D-2-hydroxyacid dehydrogenase [Spirochaetaceae bacterium]|nr:MAG: D-2-hydroxyacid dehydrogenase [Spirochaetaceae bacterium]
MKIVVLDGNRLNPGDNPWDEVAAFGELDVHDWSEPHQVVERAKDADIILTNKSLVRRDSIEKLPKLKYISVLATGYNIVDVQAAWKRNIPVSNVPEYGTDSVAQFVFALLLELCHHVGVHGQAVQSGEWERSGTWSLFKTPHVELVAKTMAIVGFGRIGRRVGELAHAFGMKVLAVDIREDNPPAYKPFEFVSLEEAFRRADVVSLNCALTAENEGIVDRKLLASMKSNALLINAARGPLVREADLSEALNAGTIAGAALDVVSTEPIRSDNPLLKAKNCIITPHIAWASLEARQRLMKTTADNIGAFLRGKPQNVVIDL